MTRHRHRVSQNIVRGSNVLDNLTSSLLKDGTMFYTHEGTGQIIDKRV